MVKPKVLFVVGTRPDAIKSAPVVREFRRFVEVDSVLVSTGQHKEMLTQALGAFGLEADYDLAVMKHGQTLGEVTARILAGLDEILDKEQPDMVIAQGDTTTTFVAGLASFYRQIPYGHVEAGLRTDSVWNPFPEEFNRRAVGLFAKFHFAPTGWSAENLYREGVDRDTVFVTGNTGIDAVRFTAEKTQKVWYPEHKGRVVLLTTHRRENWGEPQRQIARACRMLAERYSDLKLVVAMHKNPAVRETLMDVLGGVPRVDMIEPPDYADFVKLMQRSSLILTDSGGVQEEAPAFGIPVLVLRETTERPEGVDAGTARLIGTDFASIVKASEELLDSEESYLKMAQAISPYGDGMASARIRYVVMKSLGVETPEVAMWA